MNSADEVRGSQRMVLIRRNGQPSSNVNDCGQCGYVAVTPRR